MRQLSGWIRFTRDATPPLEDRESIEEVEAKIHRHGGGGGGGVRLWQLFVISEERDSIYMKLYSPSNKKRGRWREANMNRLSNRTITGGQK